MYLNNVSEDFYSFYGVDVTENIGSRGGSKCGGQC